MGERRGVFKFSDSYWFKVTLVKHKYQINCFIIFSKNTQVEALFFKLLTALLNDASLIVFFYILYVIALKMIPC